MKAYITIKCWILRLFCKNSVYYINGNETLPPPLLAEEEDRMIANIDEEYARRALIEHNLRLVAHIVKKYQNAILPHDGAQFSNGSSPRISLALRI